jgi:hypothetical protein
VDVGERVVGHHALGDDSVGEEPVQRAAGEGGDGGGSLVVVDLRVGQAAAVVDDRVHVLEAHPPRALGAVTGQRVAGRLELPEALDVHVQQLAGARPLVANDRRPGAGLGPRAASAAQHPMHRRVRPTDLDGQASRAPPGPAAQLADPPLLVGRHPRRARLRATRALGQARQRRALLGQRGPPAAHPLPHRGLRDVRPGGRLGERLALLDDTTHDLPAPQRRVAGSMVRHFRASLRDVSRHPHPLGRPGPTRSRSERPWARHVGRRLAAPGLADAIVPNRQLKLGGRGSPTRGAASSRGRTANRKD